jgi:hypothetical protein
MYQRIDQLEAKFPDDLKAQQELLKIGIVGRISVNKEQDGAHGLEMLHLIKLDRSSIKPTPPPLREGLKTHGKLFAVRFLSGRTAKGAR